MAFDAGTIDARLTVDTSAFDRSLAKAKADVDKFEREGHKVKISAVFDSGSMTRARKMFSDLDNAISRDAMNRLRSSPQGSVLGSLNALFSPHPVSGAPSPSQSAQGGLLGKMLSPASAGGPSGGGSGSPLADALAQNAYTTDNIRRNITGAAPGDTATTDTIRQALVGQGAADTTTTDKIVQQIVGAGPGDTSTTDTVKERIDPASRAATKKAAADSGDQSGTSFMGMFTSHIKNLLPKPATDDLKKKAKSAGDDAGNVLDKGLLGGIGPGILGLSTKWAGIVTGVGSALAALPALAGLIGTGMGVAMIAGLLAEAIKGNKQLTAQFKAVGGDFTSTLQKAVAPVVPIISKAIGSLAPMIKSLQGPLTGIFKTIAPQLQGIFAGLGPIIKGLLSVMQAAAPAFGPFIGAIEKLVGNLLPGIATVVRATTPFIKEFAGILGSLGGSLGQLFATAAPAIGASMKILGGLLGLVGDLLPIIMKLADIFAVTLAPVFTAFAGVVQTLLKPLTLIGGVIAQFAGAVLGDLGSAFGAVATLITAVGPGLNVLAKAFGSLFAVLENAGVFAIFGDALENLAPALGKLIGLLITDLAPILPMIVGLFSQMLTIVIELASGGLGVLIRVLTDLVQALPVGVIQALVGGFIALKLVMLGFQGIGLIFGAIGTAMGALDAALASSTVKTVASAVAQGAAWVAAGAASVASFVATAAAATAAFIAENLATLGIVAGVALLVAAVVYLATHWSQVWGDIKNWTVDAWHFLDNILHNGIVNDILMIVAPLAFLALHWKQTWAVIQTIASDAAGFLAGVWRDISGALTTAWDAIAGFFTRWWDDEVAGFRNDTATIRNLLAAAWGDISGGVRTAWDAISGFFARWWDGEVAAVRNGVATIEGILSAAWASAYDGVVSAWDFILAYLRAWPGRAVAELAVLGGELEFLGYAVFSDMLAGIKSGAGTIVSWLEGFAKDVINVFKDIWGWFSPSTVMYQGGKALMDGLAAGVKDHAHKAVAQVTSVAGRVTAGVAQWTKLVQQALGMEGLPLSLTGNVLYQMQTESGGNAAAINLTDSNAAAGDPSRGLMQVIGTTFAEYHWPGTSGNIYDPLANIAAALNYARNVYGPTLMSGGMGIGSGHGYALGGPISEPIIGYGVNSGQRYTFGENGPEWVTPGGTDPAAGGPGGSKLADSISLMMPEGSTVAATLNELTWYLQNARLRQLVP